METEVSPDGYFDKVCHVACAISCCCSSQRLSTNMESKLAGVRVLCYCIIVMHGHEQVASVGYAKVRVHGCCLNLY